MVDNNALFAFIIVATAVVSTTGAAALGVVYLAGWLLYRAFKRLIG